MPKTPPRVSLELVEWLEETFPDRCPSVGTQIEQVWADAGAARVVRKLRQLHDNELNTTVLKK